MRFSIFMPTWNRPQFLPRAVASVTQQTHSDWELHIAAAGTSLECDLPDDPRILVTRRRHDEHCLNRLMSQATGDVFCVAADDDELVDDALQIVQQHMPAAVSWAYGRINVGGRGIAGRKGSYEQLVNGNFIPLPASFWRRQVAIEFDETIGPAADYDYWLRLWKITEPVFIPRVLSIYGVHPAQDSKVNAADVEASALRARQKART